MTSLNLIHSTDKDFEKDVIKSDLPVFVDFWAEWCGPCRMVAPVVDELSKQYEGKMKFVKLNIDENPQIPNKFNIRGIPTLIIFDQGEAVKRIVGAAPKEYYVKEINAVLNGR